MTAKFNLPDFYTNPTTYTFLFELQQDNPEIFLDNTEIVSIFGCVPNCIWNGGSTFFGTTLLRKGLEEIVNLYNNIWHMPLRLTFTNCLLKEEHCYDSYCNLVAEVFETGMNEILVASPILEKYLRQHYPNYKYCRSIIAAENIPYDTSYDLTVLKRCYNNNWEFLNSIPKEERHKIEILCTDPCPVDCPRIYEHYKEFATAQIAFDPSLKSPCSQGEKRTKFQHYEAARTNPTFVTRELIDQKYLPMGFDQFKISGRMSIGQAIGQAVEYLIKPEYHVDVTCMLIDANIGLIT